MSIVTCIRKASKILSAEDIKLFEDLLAEHAKDGNLTPKQAALKAAVDMREVIRDDYAELMRKVTARGGAAPVGDAVKFSPAWHGSPASFDEFKLESLGTGEGFQAYGHGLYFTDTKEVAEYYRDTVGEKGEGKIYKVDLAPKQDEYLLWDEDMSKQPKIMEKLGIDPTKKPILPNRLHKDMSGVEVYEAMSRGKTNLGVEPTQQAASEYLLSKGIRGIKYLDADSRQLGIEKPGFNYVIFDDKDVKIEEKISAEPEVKLSIDDEVEITPTFETPETLSLKDKFMTAIVDKFHSLTKTQKAIGSVTEEQDVDMAVIQYPGMSRARIDDFENGRQKELMDAVTDSGLSFDEAVEFLHARHAREANAVLKTRNPDREDNTALSGMSDEAAEIVLEKYSEDTKVQNIGTILDQINEEHVQQMVTDGLLTEAEAEAWRSNYKHYVPLHREDIKEGGVGHRGRGFDVRGKESKLRAGSTRQVDYKNMLAHIIAQNEDALVRAEKNRVSQAMYNLAEANPNEEMWSTKDIPTISRMKADGTVTHVPNMQDPALLAVKFEGETKYLYFNTENPHAKQIVSAMKNMDSQSMNGITQALLKINRFLSTVNTSLSPEFVISNFFRDAQTAFYNLTDTDIKGMEAKVLKSIPKAMKGIRSALRGDGSAEWSPYFDEFRRAGGMTGWSMSYDDIESRMTAIKRGLKTDQTWGLKEIKAIGKAIGDYNTIVENAVRLSTFKTARDAGVSEARAARAAKEITVNFNRRGEMAMTMNALYLFYNASVQGTARMLRAIGNPKNHRLHKMVAATIATAAIIDAVNRLATDDDEEGRSKYDLVRDRYGDRNLIIMDWAGITDDEEGVFFKIPLPWGYNIFHVLGQEFGGAISHGLGRYPEYQPMDAVGRLVGATLQSFNPMQDGSLLQTVSPTVIDPIVRISENKDWHGGPLYPNYDKSADNYTKFYQNARKSSRSIAEWLAETFRDDETLKVPSVVDVSPEWIDLGIDFTTGSLGRFAADSVNMTNLLIRGETWEVKQMPIARKVIGNVAPTDIKQDFYKSYYEILDAHKRIRRQVLDGNPEKAKEMSRSIGPRLKLIPIAKKTKSNLRKIKKQIKKFKKAGNKEVVKRLEKRQLRVMRKFSRIYNRTIYGN